MWLETLRLGELMEDRQKHTHSLGTPENKGDAGSGKRPIQGELGRLRGGAGPFQRGGLFNCSLSKEV